MDRGEEGEEGRGAARIRTGEAGGEACRGAGSSGGVGIGSCESVGGREDGGGGVRETDGVAGGGGRGGSRIIAAREREGGDGLRSNRKGELVFLLLSPSTTTLEKLHSSQSRSSLRYSTSLIFFLSSGSFTLEMAPSRTKGELDLSSLPFFCVLPSSRSLFSFGLTVLPIAYFSLPGRSCTV